MSTLTITLSDDRLAKLRENPRPLQHQTGGLGPRQHRGATDAARGGRSKRPLTTSSTKTPNSIGVSPSALSELE